MWAGQEAGGSKATVENPLRCFLKFLKKEREEAAGHTLRNIFETRERLNFSFIIQTLTEIQ